MKRRVGRRKAAAPAGRRPHRSLGSATEPPALPLAPRRRSLAVQHEPRLRRVAHAARRSQRPGRLVAGRLRPRHRPPPRPRPRRATAVDARLRRLVPALLVRRSPAGRLSAQLEHHRLAEALAQLAAAGTRRLVRIPTPHIHDLQPRPASRARAPPRHAPTTPCAAPARRRRSARARRHATTPGAARRCAARRPRAAPRPRSPAPRRAARNARAPGRT